MQGSPTKHRYQVLGLLVFLFTITYLDRVCISVAGPRMQEDLHIDPIGWGWVTGVFTLAYCLFEIPTGVLGDRPTGPRLWRDHLSAIRSLWRVLGQERYCVLLSRAASRGVARPFAAATRVGVMRQVAGGRGSYYRGGAPPAVVPPPAGAGGSLPPSARIFMFWSACVNLSVLLALSAARAASFGIIELSKNSV